MRLLPMDEPAQLHWRSGEGGADEVTVAWGSLAMMARGLMAIDATNRDQFWITSGVDRLSAADAEESLRRWCAQ